MRKATIVAERPHPANRQAPLMGAIFLRMATSLWAAAERLERFVLERSMPLQVCRFAALQVGEQGLQQRSNVFELGPESAFVSQKRTYQGGRAHRCGRRSGEH